MSRYEWLALKLETVNALHQQRCEHQQLLNGLQQLKHFEKERLLSSYADIHSEQKYRRAVEFMACDVFGSDFSHRDAQMQKAFPSLIKLLPAPILQAVGIAVELNINLVRYEDALLADFLQQSRTELDVQAYCLSFNAARCEPLRKQLIEQVNLVGNELDKIVHKPFISTTLKLCRGPAKLAGLDELQGFLERGYQAFKSMGNSKKFLQTFVKREHDIMRNISEGQPEPFNVI